MNPSQCSCVIDLAPRIGLACTDGSPTIIGEDITRTHCRIDFRISKARTDIDCLWEISLVARKRITLLETNGHYICRVGVTESVPTNLSWALEV